METAMNNTILARFVTVVLGMSLLFAAGCASRSAPARFYTLDPMSGLEVDKRDVGSIANQGIGIAIAPISVPEYLKKPQIITRTSSNQIKLAEFDRWGGRLDEEMSRVIAENLSVLLATDKVITFPWNRGVKLDYTIEMQVSRFEGELGGMVELVVRWAIFDADKNKVFSVKTSRISQPVKGSSYADLVQAQSQAVAALSLELAETIKTLRNNI
jgi:uncharacterized lipoprotein YmbA